MGEAPTLRTGALPQRSHLERSAHSAARGAARRRGPELELPPAFECELAGAQAPARGGGAAEPHRARTRGAVPQQLQHCKPESAAARTHGGGVKPQPQRAARHRSTAPHREPIVHSPPPPVRRRGVREAPWKRRGAQPPATERGAARAHLERRQRRDGIERAARLAAREPGGAEDGGGAAPQVEHVAQVVDLALHATA